MWSEGKKIPNMHIFIPSRPTALQLCFSSAYQGTTKQSEAVNAGDSSRVREAFWGWKCQTQGAKIPVWLKLGTVLLGSTLALHAS